MELPGRVAQSVGRLTRKSEVLVRYPVWPHTFVSPSADSRGAVVSYWRKYVHEVLVIISAVQFLSAYIGHHLSSTHLPERTEKGIISAKRALLPNLTKMCGPCIATIAGSFNNSGKFMD